MHAEGHSNESSVYLMGRSALDRLAYTILLRDECDQNVAVDSDFAPTSIWVAMRARPDLVLLVADNPSPDVLDGAQMVARLRPATRIVVISATVEPTQVESWGRCPLHGYVVKDGGVEELHNALAAMRAGREYFSPGIQAALKRATSRRDGAAKLSRREAELLPLLATGMTLREAAAQLTVSYKTADSYRTSLLRKLGVHDRVELARYAIRERIIEP